MSDGDATKTKVINLEKLCNFVVDNFFIWNHLSFKNYVWILTFEIQNFQTTSDGQMTKTKVVDLEKLCNFIVDHFFIRNHLSKKKSREFPHIWNSNFSNNLRWRNDQNKSCRSREVMQLYSWWLFHLNSLRSQILISKLDEHRFKHPKYSNSLIIYF